MSNSHVTLPFCLFLSPHCVTTTILASLRSCWRRVIHNKFTNQHRQKGRRRGDHHSLTIQPDAPRVVSNDVKTWTGQMTIAFRYVKKGDFPQ